MLRHGIDGLLLGDNDADALAEKVIQLLRDPSLASRLAESAYRTLAAYEWRVVRNGWLQAYHRALGRTNQGTPEHTVESTPLNPA
jgi:glycosyltransferase involved in cell wall biosynthesis